NWPPPERRFDVLPRIPIAVLGRHPQMRHPRSLVLLPDHRQRDPAALRIDPVAAPLLRLHFALIRHRVTPSPKGARPETPIRSPVADAVGGGPILALPTLDHATPRASAASIHSATAAALNRRCLPTLNDGGPSPYAERLRAALQRQLTESAHKSAQALVGHAIQDAASAHDD